MGYVGNQTSTSYTSMDKQTITGSGATAYTLSHSVSSESEIEVFVNNVRQEGGSGKAYTVSGTTITFTEAVASSDSIYVIFQGKAIQTVVPPDGSVTSAKLGTSPLFKVDSSNNRVGIGTASPSRQATISRSIADGSGELGIVSSDSSTTGAFGSIHFGNGTDTSLASIRATADGATDSGKLTFNTEKTGASIETAMSIDSNGYVTTPLRPYFHGVGNSTQAWSGSAAYQNLQINTTWENHGNHYNTTNYTFTCPVAGVYFFWYTYTNTTNGSGGPEAYLVYTSGGSSSYRAAAIVYNDYYTTVGNNAVINCAKDATVVIKLNNNNGDSFTIDCTRSTFGGYLIG